MRNHLYSDYLSIFLTVAQSGSITKAAKILHLSPTALQKRLDSFEAGLKVTLLERSKRGSKLTEAGQLLLNWAPGMMHQADEFLQQLQELSSSEVINIGTSPLISSNDVVKLFLLHQAYLNAIRIRLVPFDNEPKDANEILLNLGSRIDVVSGLYDEAFLQTYDIKAQFLREVEIKLSVPVNSPLAEKKQIELSDLKGQSVMLHDPNSFELFAKAAALLEASDIRVHSVPMINIEQCNRAYQDKMPFINIEPWSGVHPLFVTRELNWELKGNYGILYAKEPKAAVARFLREIELSRQESESAMQDKAPVSKAKSHKTKRSKKTN